MGQYWKPVVFDSAGYAYTTSTTGSAKLTEHSWLRNEVCLKVCEFILNGPKLVYWVGDYCREAAEKFSKVKGNFPVQAYKLIREEYKPASELPELENPKFTVENGYLVNHTKKEYLNFKDYIKSSIDSDGWCMHPLPLLTAMPEGNGLGGGDYYSKIGMDFIGYWSGDLIEYTLQVPDGYNQIDVTFKEIYD